MKRFFLLLALVSLALCSHRSQAQSVIFTPICAGSDDTAAFQAIITGAAGADRTIHVPNKSADISKRCRVTTLSVPANITLDNTDGSGVDVVTSLADAGPRVNPVGKTMFFGAGSLALTGRAYDTAADAVNPGLVTVTGTTVVVSTNDARVPTQSENDALAGTSGSPSSSNKFVTNADTRNSDTRTPTDASVTAAKIAPALKPSGSAATTDESLRALGTSAGTALRGTYGTAFGFSTLVLKQRQIATSFSFASTATWADVSPTGANCTQTGSNRPTLVADVWNKRAAVRFTRASSQYMLCGNALDSTIIGTSGKKWISVDVVWPLSNDSQVIWSMSKFTGTDGINGGCNGGVGYPDGCGRAPRVLLLKQSDTGTTSQPALTPTVSASSDLDYLGTPLSLVYYGSADVYNQPTIIVSVFNQDGSTDADKEQISVNGVNQTMQAVHAGGSGASQNFNSAQLTLGADLARATTGDAYAPINAANYYLFEHNLFQGDLSTQASKDELAQFVAGLAAYYNIPNGSQVYTGPSGNTGVNSISSATNSFYIGGAGKAGNQIALNENISSNSAATVQWRLKNDAGNVGTSVLYGSNSPAASGFEGANAFTLLSSAGDINLVTVASKPIKFWVGVTEIARLSEANHALYLNDGNTIGRGTTSNTDLMIELTMSGGGSNTYTFTKTYAHAPLCVLTKHGGAATIAPWYDSTTTTLTMHGDASAVITAHCFAQD